MPTPTFKVRRLSISNVNDEILLRKINIYSTEKEKTVTSFTLSNKQTFNFGKKIKPNPDANYLKFYRQHNIWLNKVIYDIEAGRKVAFGAFRNYTNPVGTLFVKEPPEECLIGSVIIKKGHSGQIELKNLITDHNEIRKCFGDDLSVDKLNENKTKVRQKLIDRCENFCSFRNYRRIEIEIYSTSYDLINLFLKNEYRIIHTRRSKYKESDYFYIFSKNLSNFQGNDPYDYQFLVKNILSYYFPFQEMKTPVSNSLSNVDDLDTINYTIKSIYDTDTQVSNNYTDLEERGLDGITNGASFNNSDEQELTSLKNFNLTVECKVDFDLTREEWHENNLILINDQFLKNYDVNSNLKILFTDKKVFNEGISASEGSRAIKILEWKNFESLENVRKLYLAKLLKKSEIEGFLLVVEEKVKSRIIEFSKKDDFYTIHMFDGCGNYLKNADNIKYHKSLKIFFYSHSLNGGSQEGIWGYANLVTQSGGAKNFFEDEDESNYRSGLDLSKSIYDDSDLNYFSFYNDEKNKNVIILSVHGIKILDPIVPLDNTILSDKMIDYVYNREGGGGSQWFDTFWFNSYLDHKTVENILKLDMNSSPNEADKISAVNAFPNLQSNMNESLMRVVILTAIQEEYLAVKSQLIEIKDASKEDTGYEEGIFEYEGKRISRVFIRECGQSNATAAVETERAIRNFHPLCMFFVGIAGSRKRKDFSIGDVIFPEKIYSYEGGKSKLDSFSARPDLASLSFTFKELAKKARRNDDWKILIKNNPVEKQSLKANLGVIASGEKIVEHISSDAGKILFEHYEDTSAVEMEGFGFAKIASTYQGRKDSNIFIAVVRGISDILGFDDESKTGQESESRPKGNKELASNSASAFAYWLLMKFHETQE